jgi:hypothetical protein
MVSHPRVNSTVGPGLPSPEKTESERSRVSKPFAGVIASGHSEQHASEMNAAQGLATNCAVADQYKGIINQSVAVRVSSIQSGDPRKVEESKRRFERCRTALIEFIDLGYSPWLVTGWSYDVFAGQIVPGMPLDLVEAYWGDPLYIQSSGPEEILTYPFGGLFRQVILVQGRVTDVRIIPGS